MRRYDPARPAQPRIRASGGPAKPLRWQPKWWVSKARILRFALALAGLWVAYQLLGSEESLLVGLSARRQRVKLEEEIAALEAKSEAIRQVRARIIKDPEFLEQIAREQQAMRKDGEKVILLVPREERGE
jgi:cell division protein FtsB